MGVSSRTAGDSRSSYSFRRLNLTGALLITALLAATPLGLAAERHHIVFTRNAPARSGYSRKRLPRGGLSQKHAPSRPVARRALQRQLKNRSEAEPTKGRSPPGQNHGK
jgi:hypothetical protein